MVQMVRPDRLKQGRYVQRICQVCQERGAPRLKELFMRDRGFKLQAVAGEGWPLPPEGVEPEMFRSRVERARKKIAESGQGA
jgi:hypothetical protein